MHPVNPKKIRHSRINPLDVIEYNKDVVITKRPSKQETFINGIKIIENVQSI